jgi:hypothetical protein
MAVENLGGRLFKLGARNRLVLCLGLFVGLPAHLILHDVAQPALEQSLG